MKIEVPGGQLYYEQRGGCTVELVEIIVDHKLRRQGIGTKLIQLLEDKCRFPTGSNRPIHIYLFTRRVNTVAVEFYKSCGFSYLTILPDFYQDSKTCSDAFMFGKIV